MPTETQKTKEERGRLHKEIRSRTIGYIVTAFGLVAGLAWNDAVKSLINHVFPASTDANGVFAQFSYAIIITLLVVVVTYQLTKFADGDEQK